MGFGKLIHRRDVWANIWNAILAAMVAQCESYHGWPNPEVLLSLSSRIWIIPNRIMAVQTHAPENGLFGGSNRVF